VAVSGTSIADAEPIAPEALAPAVPGCGAIRVARVEARSAVTRAYATSPLRLLTPANHGRAAWVYTSTYGGGLVDGDRVALDVDVAAGASAFVSTQSATKVYRSPRGTASGLRARVGAGGLLVHVPDHVVCFAGSRYRQHQQFDLEADAGLIAVDGLSSGRLASGERWAFHEYASRLVVRVDDRLVVYEAITLRQDDGDLAVRFGRFNALAIVVLAGAAVVAHAAAMVSAVRDRPRAQAARTGPAGAVSATQLVAATPLRDGGCVVRVGGQSAEAVARTVRGLLNFAPALLGDDPWARKW
jgi:urease accessory protein